MKKPICGYHLDEHGDWVAELVCGHFQHVRHQPPFINRLWVETPQGRNSKLGLHLACKKCDERAPKDSIA